jgi:hypothetical protein
MRRDAVRDEYGTPDECLEECDDCGTLFRSEGRHRCTDGWVSWTEWRRAQEVPA